MVKANQQNRVLITFDNDFAELVYRHKRKAYGVILLKFVPNSFQQISEVVLNVLSAKTKIEGNFVTVTEKRIRVIRIK